MVRQADRLQVVIASNGKTIKLKGRNRILIPAGKWRRILAQASTGPGRIRVEVTAKEDGLWTRYAPFNIYITPETVDPYLSYRLIEPGYEVWKSLQLAERNVETFRERIIADNSLTDNSCMNCHTYGNQDPGLSFFHLRGPGGGTVLNRNGELRKININNPDMISPVVYGNIHPSGDYGVFSSNIVLPGFHTLKGERLEVYDSESDLVIVDFRDNTVTPFPEDFPRELRTFPVFSADGNTVFYCNAPQISVPDSIYHLKYDLLKISFDPASGSWGSKADTVVNASSLGLSVCHPKTSPDGKYLLFTMADYGTFPFGTRKRICGCLTCIPGRSANLKVSIPLIPTLTTAGHPTAGGLFSPANGMTVFTENLIFALLMQKGMPANLLCCPKKTRVSTTTHSNHTIFPNYPGGSCPLVQQISNVFTKRHLQKTFP